MSAVFGGGQASAKGSVNWNNAAITGYSGEAHIHTPSIKSTYYKGALDGDLRWAKCSARWASAET